MVMLVGVASPLLSALSSQMQEKKIGNKSARPLPLCLDPSRPDQQTRAHASFPTVWASNAQLQASRVLPDSSSPLTTSCREVEVRRFGLLGKTRPSDGKVCRWVLPSPTVTSQGSGCRSSPLLSGQLSPVLCWDSGSASGDSSGAAFPFFVPPLP